MGGHRQKVLLENSVGPAADTDRGLAAMTDGVAAESDWRLANVAIAWRVLASVF